MAVYSRDVDNTLRSIKAAKHYLLSKNLTESQAAEVLAAIKDLQFTAESCKGRGVRKENESIKKAVVFHLEALAKQIKEI